MQPALEIDLWFFHDGAQSAQARIQFKKPGLCQGVNRGFGSGAYRPMPKDGERSHSIFREQGMNVDDPALDRFDPGSCLVIACLRGWPVGEQALAVCQKRGDVADCRTPLPPVRDFDDVRCDPKQDQEIYDYDQPIDRPRLAEDPIEDTRSKIDQDSQLALFASAGSSYTREGWTNQINVT